MADLAPLLEPVPGDAPTGVNLRYVDGDLTFQEIEENRLDQDEIDNPEGEAKPANWPKVVGLCSEALRTRSKDLQLAAWLTEGLAHTEGLAGVRDGLRLTKELIHKYWDQLHPGYEDGELIPELRAKPIVWLGSPNCFLPAVKSIPLISGPGRQLAWRDYEMSSVVDEAAVQSDQSKYNEFIEAGFINGETWLAGVSNTARDTFEAHLGTLDECCAELEELLKLCDERFGADDAPSLVELSNLFSDMREFLQKHVGTGEALVEEGEVVEGAGAAGAPGRAAGPINSRAAALQQLEEVARFFRQTEPHSPVSYLVQRAVKWGNMPLEDLLKEVVKDTNTLSQIWDTLGIVPSGGEG